MTKNYSRIIGFTIVEILVVIAIVGVIAAISTVGYGSWQQQIARKEVASDLQLAMTAMENAKNFSNGYPTALPASFKESSSVERPTIQWRDGTRYCMQANSKEFPTLRFYVDSTQGDQVRTGVCPASPIVPTVPPAAPAPGSTPTSSSSITVSWSSVQYATGYTVRYGTGTPSTVACTTASTTCVINGLTANTVYNVTVVATNAYGTSPAGTSSATTFAVPPPAPSGTPAIGVTGPVVYTTPYPYNRYTVTASGVSCASGSLQWKFIVSTSATAPSAATWSDEAGWQAGNTYQFDVTRNRLDNYRYIFAKPRCSGAGGLSTQHSSYASSQVLSQG